MRVLHVTPYFEGAWAYGGIPRAAAVTVHGLVIRGHQVTVCTTDACRADARLTIDRGRTPAVESADVRVFPNLSNAVAYHLQFFLPIGLRAYLRANAGRFDIAHLHGCHHLPGALASRHLRRAGVPYVLTPHGTAPYLERRQLAKRLFDATLGRGVLNGAARVVAVSNAERKQLVGIGVSEAKIAVIPNPLDMREFKDVPRGAFRRRLGIGHDERIVLFLGKLTAQKRLDVLVEAFAGLRRQDTRLVLAGNDMGYGRTVRRLVELSGLSDRVILPGLLTSQERLSALADADVVVYASEGEVFGLVPVEALLCGTPVIVSDDSGCGEVVSATGGGLLVPPGNPNRLRDALAQILSDEDAWKRLALEATERAQRYSSDRVCATIEALYGEVIADVAEARKRSTV